MEEIICIPANTIPDGFYIAGHPLFEQLLDKIQDSRFKAIRDKTDKKGIEFNKSIRQLITYSLVKMDPFVYIYQRTSGTGEQRLAGLYALPGGHMNTLSESFRDDVVFDSFRELSEELSFFPIGSTAFFPGDFPVDINAKIVAIIQSSCDEDLSGVQLVHTGIVTLTDISGNYDIKIKETASMTNITLVTPATAISFIPGSEKWLQTVLIFLDQLVAL